MNLFTNDLQRVPTLTHPLANGRALVENCLFALSHSKANKATAVASLQGRQVAGFVFQNLLYVNGISGTICVEILSEPI